MADALGALPLFAREVYRLAAGDGLSEQMIAGRLGVPVAEVQAHLARALVGLADALDGDRGGS